MTTRTRLRFERLALKAAEALSRHAARLGLTDAESVTIRTDTAVVIITVVPPPTVEQQPTTPAPVPVANLTEMEQDVLQAVAEADGPLKGEEIAKAAGYECTSRFREVLAALVRHRRLRRSDTGRGYLPAEGPVQ
jgi:hypothetical protein